MIASRRSISRSTSTVASKNAGLRRFDLMQLHTWEDSWLQDDRWYHKLSRSQVARLVSRDRHQPEPLGTVERRRGRARAG